MQGLPDLSGRRNRPYHLRIVQILATALFVLTGIVNLLPVTGVLSTERLQALYGVAFDDPNVIILMRHRAVLFGIVGTLLIAAAFHLPLRPTAVAAGLLSMFSFVVIAQGVGGFNTELRRVVLADVVGSILLVVAGLAHCWVHCRAAA